MDFLDKKFLIYVIDINDNLSRKDLLELSNIQKLIMFRENV